MRSALLLAGAGLRSRRRLGLAVTLLVLVLAAIGIAAGLVVTRQGAPLLDAAADDARVAHLVVFGDADAIERVASDPEVVARAGPFPTLDGLELLAAGEEVPLRVVALDSPDVAVNRPVPRAGPWARRADEIVLDRSLAVDLGLEIGDRIAVRSEGSTTRFTVVGTGVDFTDCFYPQCDPGRAWVTTAGLDRFDAADRTFAQGWLRFDDPEQADPFVQQQAADGVEGITGTESWLDTRGDFLTLDRIFGSFVAAFGLFVLAVAAVVVAGSTAMRVVANRRAIGLYGAIGCTPRQITAGLLLENLGLGVVAAAIGWFLAGFLAPSLQLGIGRTLGTQGPTWTALGLAAAVVAISLLMLLATVVPAVSAARRPVTDVLRDIPRDHTSWFNRRASALPRRLSLVGAQEAASQPVRSALAALAITVAVVGTIVSIGFIDGIGGIADDPAREGDPWRVALVAGDTPRDRIETALDDEPGVDQWFADQERRSTFRDGAFLSVATDGDPDAAGYRITRGRAMRDAGEAIAGYGFLQRFDVDVGDRVDIRAGTTPLRLTIVGEYRDTEDSGEVLRYRWESLAAAEPGVEPDVYRIEPAAGVGPDALARTLRQQLGPGVRTEILDTGAAGGGD